MNTLATIAYWEKHCVINPQTYLPTLIIITMPTENFPFHIVHLIDIQTATQYSHYQTMANYQKGRNNMLYFSREIEIPPPPLLDRLLYKETSEGHEEPTFV